MIQNTKEHTSDLEDRIMEITQSEQKKKKINTESSLRDLWNNIKSTSMSLACHYTGSRRRREREEGQKYI